MISLLKSIFVKKFQADSKYDPLTFGKDEIPPHGIVLGFFVGIHKMHQQDPVPAGLLKHKNLGKSSLRLHLRRRV